MAIQQLIEPQQNNLLDMFVKAQAIKASRSTNALNEAKARELPYEREREAALNNAKIKQSEALTGKSEADTGRIDQEAGQRDLEFIARFAGDRGAVLGTFAKWSEKMPQLAPIAERLAGIQDPNQFKAEVQGFAMSTLDRMKETRAQTNMESQVAYRDSMRGKPMVIQTPGGTYTYPQDNPQDTTRLDTGPSAAEAAETASQRPTPKIAAQNRDKLQTIAVLESQLAKVQAAFKGIENTYSAGAGGGYLPTEHGRAFDAAVDGLRPFLRQISRTPGEGAMSDYETKQAESLLPSRNEYENVTAQKIQQIMDVVAELKSGYPDGGQTTPGGARRVVIPYGSAGAPAGEPKDYQLLLDELMQ